MVEKVKAAQLSVSSFMEQGNQELTASPRRAEQRGIFREASWWL